MELSKGDACERETEGERERRRVRIVCQHGTRFVDEREGKSIAAYVY